jgi:hypothetical protein
MPSNHPPAGAKISSQADAERDIRWDCFGMAQFTARTTVKAPPEQVLEVLTDPDEIRSWSPIPFELDKLAGRKLAPGSVTRVSGSLVGRRVGFDVEVHAADADGLELTAAGPIAIDVLYSLEPVEGGSEVTASIGVRGGSGLTGRLLATATSALLRSGVLDLAAGRIAQAAEAAPCLAVA